MHIVLKPFPYSPDGLRIVHLLEGDQRDFGNLAPGLLAAGCIGEIEQEPQLALDPPAVELAAHDEPEVPSAVEPEAEPEAHPAEEHHAPRRGRRSKAHTE